MLGGKSDEAQTLARGQERLLSMRPIAAILISLIQAAFSQREHGQHHAPIVGRKPPLKRSDLWL
jgi:hypothetical protein